MMLLIHEEKGGRRRGSRGRDDDFLGSIESRIHFTAVPCMKRTNTLVNITQQLTGTAFQGQFRVGKRIKGSKKQKEKDASKL